MYVVRSSIAGGTIFYGASACLYCEITHHRGHDLLLASACICCEIMHHSGYDLLRASACVCCEITYHRRFTICYGHPHVNAERSHMTEGAIWVQFITGIGVCML